MRKVNLCKINSGYYRREFKEKCFTEIKVKKYRFWILHLMCDWPRRTRRGAPEAVQLFLLFPNKAKNHLKIIKKRQYKGKLLAFLIQYTTILGARLPQYPFLISPRFTRYLPEIVLLIP